MPIYTKKKKAEIVGEISERKIKLCGLCGNSQTHVSYKSLEIR